MRTTHAATCAIDCALENILRPCPTAKKTGNLFSLSPRHSAHWRAGSTRNRDLLIGKALARLGILEELLIGWEGFVPDVYSVYRDKTQLPGLMLSGDGRKQLSRESSVSTQPVRDSWGTALGNVKSTRPRVSAPAESVRAGVLPGEDNETSASHGLP